ncbi:MAG TPA: peptidyl-prolyl cis-trans isomerase [Polyangiaceae bacterium]|nr:peptidyl-prolyl cis-trans isomerase [Polyangiaceae bacterium]
MRRLYRRSALVVALASASAFAADSAPAVVSAGPETADAAALARAFGRVPAFQLAALGANDAARRHAVVERLLTPELQGAAEARARGLDKLPRTADRLRELYSRAMDAELGRLTAEQQPVTDAEVQKYFDSHRDRFETPRRIRIWRILVNDEELAKKIISESQGGGGPARWRNFARDSSLDTATKMRDGDLGFVRPDGSTETPQLRVDPALFAAVDKLSDGQIVAEPLKVQAGIAVVWRRGSLPAISRTVAQEAPAIRTVLTRERLEAARRDLVGELRKQSLKALDTQLLETLPDSMFAPSDTPARALPPLPSSSAARAGAETPKAGESGTR